MRTRMAAGLSPSDEGVEHRVAGWVHRRRDLGGLLFVDLRDRSGLLQISFGPGWTGPASLERAQQLGSEDVVQVSGTVRLRPGDARNPDLPTGDIEVRASSLRILAKAETPAIPVHRPPEDELPSEELRLRHRHLDLRRRELQERLALRHRLVLATRNYMDALGFVEIETPILTKPTPEGARDYLVPSRVQPGEFYALPQSPQIYKQVLMTAGFDRYFQIARCFRDEDLRADRQPEFTQVDIEASFISTEDLFGWIEGLMTRLSEIAGVEAPTPFARMTFGEAMERYGTDRPDLRNPLVVEDWTGPLGRLDFTILRSIVEKGGRIRGIRLGGGGRLSRRDLSELEGVAKEGGLPGLLWVKRREGGGSGPLARFMAAEDYEALGMGAGDLALVAAGGDRVTSPALAAVRLAAGLRFGLPPELEHAWLWVMDFPLFEEGEEGGPLTPGHHPFVLPHPGDLSRLDEAPLEVRALAYDLVYNGSEIGSGSLRIADAELQRKILGHLGMNDEEIERRFGFLLRALRSGAPPHGGIALGVERLVSEFSGADSLRDVVAFPKTTAARALYEGAPSRVDTADLAELGLKRS